jgi:hypothetical protein
LETYGDDDADCVWRTDLSLPGLSSGNKAASTLISEFEEKGLHLLLDLDTVLDHGLSLLL